MTGRALTLSTGVASVRPRQRLTPVLAQLGRHRDVPSVRHLLESATA
ncbi:hypothetical protein [Streptomyces prasinopilosus]|uniref:Uncharacterized protein n=1 Tax=Streptomyces prasinopilosus TaxID=67344 RepID=A0A1G6R8V3_9ACTN|nr:hypothetical protein [Streptomyces prasinopilosus]SDD00871.1 hypothetical protein SAMN05216505_104432 [Streptomyces prasinopilosus]